MEEIKRKKHTWGKAGSQKKLWVVLSILWLVTACLGGCVPGTDGTGTAGAGQTVKASETYPENEVSEAEKVGNTEPVSAQTGPEALESVRSESGTGETGESGAGEASLTVEESGFYTSKEEVAFYIHLYGHLPDNYITKRQAEEIGWDSKAGNLWEVAPGMSIGGSRFGNYEGALPDKEGRTYFECDIDYEGGYRGAKRIIYSDDGLIFYTEDHYKTFEKLYGQ